VHETEPNATAMNRPRYMSATRAPGLGVKLDTAFQMNSILWEATLLRWYCFVRYVIRLLLSPIPATFSSISFARHPKKKREKNGIKLKGKRTELLAQNQQLPGTDWEHIKANNRLN
jgi:hypothetical protein